MHVSIGRLDIVVPAPPRALSPNARVHWAARLRAQRAYQRHVAGAIALALAGRAAPRWTGATAHYTFVFRARRRRDRDNLIASLKCAQDCLQHAGVVVDDSVIAIGGVTIDHRPDAQHDTVTITITGADDAATSHGHRPAL